MASRPAQSTMLESLVHHIALPPQLPQQQERVLSKIQDALLDHLLAATNVLKALHLGTTWDCIRRSIQTCKSINSGGTINKIALLAAFRELENGSDELLVLHVAEQNAAVLIRRDSTNRDSVIFEAFETSPLSEEVLAANGPLEWDFPGGAVTIPFSTFSNPTFQNELAAFLSQASSESIKRFAARANKAGVFVFESRDTVDPALITSMLMTLLEANGTRSFPPILRKRVRDDVYWSEGAERPWRRCPFWLVVRVAIQRHLLTLLGGEAGRLQYKFLMCQVLADLLEEGSRTWLDIELLSFLNSKLCRRIAKLKVDKQRAHTKIQAVYDSMFSALQPFFEKVTTIAVSQIETAWAGFKKNNQRPMLIFPRRSDPRHLRLSLPNSASYIDGILSASMYDHQRPQPSTARTQAIPEFLTAINGERIAFANRYVSLSDFEINMEQISAEPTPTTEADCQDRCISLADYIEEYLIAVGNAYDGNPEQKSMMLLTIMELWVSMEKCAIQLFVLLRDFNPVFPTELLDVLQVSSPKDMRRLQSIRSYLKHRHASCSGRLTIFSSPVRGCFGERYFEESKGSLELKDLYRQIEDEAEEERRDKQQEWQSLSADYEQRIRAAAESTHMKEEDYYGEQFCARNCQRCLLDREASRLSINVHEHPLPSDSVEAKVTVFELACPPAFAAYREATWRIIGSLSVSSPMEQFPPKLLLAKYPGLRDFLPDSLCSFTLASTKKSFVVTHYRTIGFPVSLEAVCVPNGLRFEYYDQRNQVWPGRQILRPTFAHHCQLIIPTSSPFVVLLGSPDFNSDSKGPSSYATIASQSRCPPGVNVHEFMAYQALFSGKTRRWPQILMELGASNLNFSTEATALLLCHLALQIGPSLDDNHLGSVHTFFNDEIFCTNLLKQLSLRLDGISSNWRETNCMEAIITLTIRLNLLGTGSKSASQQLLEKVRDVTFKWTTELRSEVRAATNLQTSLSLSTSITMQDNIASDVASLPILLRISLVRDIKMIYGMRYLLRTSLLDNPHSSMYAIKTVWPNIEEVLSKKLSPFQFLESHEWWVEVTIEATHHTLPQTVHFHVLDGHLLIDGKPIGKLPARYTTHIILTELFGNQNLPSYPSNLPGMNYTLTAVQYGHQIHLGFRNDYLVVRALQGNRILEFLPRQIFSGPQSFDLPASLVDNCVHWLDIRTGSIEIRQRPQIWMTNGRKQSNWTLDYPRRRAYRRESALIDPNSPLFKQFSRAFEFFEASRFLTVVQPPYSSALVVELRRLELVFFVNDRNCLESSQLRAEIDLDQDAGTWYGLQSKIVLREKIPGYNYSMQSRQRSIIVPMGTLIQYKRHGIHIATQVESIGGFYGRYTINKALGRLDCPAEPRLLYFKALCHAYTSFFLPDSLTGRTGTEEALHCLAGGSFQPWTPLEESHIEMLGRLASLTPRREYYPLGLKVMQRAFWNSALTSNIQHDGFRAAVNSIFLKSNQLLRFASGELEPCALEPGGDEHLTTRSHLRRLTYERPNLDSNSSQVSDCYPYAARDVWRTSQRRSNVVESANLILKWSSKMTTTTDLAGILQSWGKVGGYNGEAEKVLLSDLLGLEFAPEWGSFVNFCQNSSPDDLYRLMFLFSVASFRQDADMDTIRTLLAFAIIEDLKCLIPPTWPLYEDFRHNQVPRMDDIQQMMKRSNSLVPYQGDELSNLEFNLSAKLQKKAKALERAYEQHQEADMRQLGEFLLKQWPCPEPSIKGFTASVFIDISQALDAIRPAWLRLFQNFELSCHISQVQEVLDRHYTDDKSKVPHAEIQEQAIYSIRYRGGEFPTLSQLLRKMGPTLPSVTRIGKAKAPKKEGSSSEDYRKTANRSSRNSGAGNLHSKESSNEHDTPESQELQAIIEHVINSDSNVRRQYGKDLTHSLKALGGLKRESRKQNLPSAMTLAEQISAAQKTVSQNFTRLSNSFEENDTSAHWLRRGGLWPVITPISILETLRSTLQVSFGTNMKEYIVLYALSITNIQRLIRMEEASLNKNEQRLIEEQNSRPHSNWAPIDRSDWLLLELDSNILIRPGQVDVALATISPASRANSVLQMNMGQGKTSCIMPMAAAVLGDGRNLLRVVVPKALLLQTAQLLHARLGGLLGRELKHIPFSRKTSTDERTIQLFDRIHKDIQKSCGVILALPEHLLSFKLSGLQRLSDSLIPEAKTMVNVQSYLNRFSRDILDEADYILAIRTQLIYPSGSQKTVDGHPHRWETIEALLKIVESNLFNLRKKFPQSIEVVQSTQGRFPVVYFLRKDVEDAMISRLVDEIYRGRTSILPEDLTKSDRLAIRDFISQPNVALNVRQQISRLLPEKPAVKQAVHLLRGLLVHRILLMTLKKRWNVQYGLHPLRDPMAVPYHAKGTPSDQAEWGHPDVAILLTCLAFYHGGLNIAQLRQTLEHVLKSDDPSQVYDSLSQSSSLPDSLRDWGSINIDDEAQILEIWTHVRYQVIVVDYFLNNFVFPQHAKQFQLKLQASGWDIPLFSLRNLATAVEKSCASNSLQLPLTTGFSGTNDSKRMLPLTIKQQDLSGLAHTNAEVLTYLLQQRNRQYVLAADHQGKRLSERGLLQRISNVNIRVFIDAGAQIEEMDNYTLAKTWLEIVHNAPAAVYFRDNKPFVLYRHGRQIPLLASSYADDLGEALVYLDQAHTRGTDLKMPARAAGALTLGLDQSKDHTVQAAMRLRQLGTTQSVVWFAPPEVHQSILDVREKKLGDSITSYDVVHWLLEQTCVQIEQLQPLYISQGNDFCRRAQAALKNAEFLVDEEQRESYLATLRQYEQQTLEQQYGVNQKAKKSDSSTIQFSGDLAAFDKELKSQRKNFQDSGHAVHGSALQEVEQEREVAFEVENVREVQKPVHFQPFSFPSLHRDLVSFVKTGRMPADSAAYEDAFVLLRRTSVGRKHRVSSDGTATKLYVSTEFTKTVKFPTDRSFENFQRQPNWILWSTTSGIALVIIPEEAELIIPLLFHAKDPPTYLLTYVAPVTRKMLQHFNDLKFYSIPNLPSTWEAPSWLKVELGLFAGRLYFDYSEYAALCEFLGVKESAASLEEVDDDFELGPPALDGVVEEEVPANPQESKSKVFARKPLTFLHEWLAVRRKGQDFASSPMGQVCQGKPLTSDHTFFIKPEATRTSNNTEHTSVKRSVPVSALEEDDAEDDIYDENAFGKIRPGEIDTFDDAALKDDSSEDSSEESD
ncbi:hypothetical protein LOCC1_G002062 [Lachnellula occidentalis]|uniref:ubiquitinyl hydrolase 1 n=1 Tax=Lachnellula occidentalis TaxID=215460 RepID=A0A8H8UHX4_9HELO|nr:hypothetical protein LOCC1_G002062 [Lachnellula occidentalis]